MPLESWLVITVAAAFFLLGIAGSPLAWAMLSQRRTRFERGVEQTVRKLPSELRTLDDRLNRLEMVNAAKSLTPDLVRGELAGGRSLLGSVCALDRTKGGIASSPSQMLAGGRGTVRCDSAHVPTLIAVPNLEEAPGNREVTVGGLRERYAAIWTLAEKGASAEVIARATGQPVGQIELILGLRRRIDGTTSNSSHAPSS